MIHPPYTEEKTRRWIEHLRTFKPPTEFAATGLIAWMADQIWPPIETNEKEPHDG